MDKRPTTALAAVILVATSAFVAVVAWLHIVRPDLDPVRYGVSRYAAGPHGDAVTFAFAALALALLLAGSQLQTVWHRRSLWTAAIGLALVVLFPLKSSAAAGVEYVLHQLGGAVFFIAATVGVQGVSNQLRAASASAPLRTTARASGVVAAVALVAFLSSVLARAFLLSGPVGLFQRICLAAICAAVLGLAVGLLRVPAPRSGHLASPRPP